MDKFYKMIFIKILVLIVILLQLFTLCCGILGTVCLSLDAISGYLSKLGGSQQSTISSMVSGFMSFVYFIITIKAIIIFFRIINEFKLIKAEKEAAATIIYISLYMTLHFILLVTPIIYFVFIMKDDPNKTLDTLVGIVLLVDVAYAYFVFRGIGKRITKSAE